MPKPSAWHIVVLVVALIVLFGWKSLPNMARSLGQSMRIFKSEVDQMKGPSAASQDTVRGERTGDDRADDRGRGENDRGQNDTDDRAYEERERRLRDRASDVRDRASDVRDRASDLGDRAKDTAGDVRDRGAHVADEFRSGLREGEQPLRDDLRDDHRA